MDILTLSLILAVCILLFIVLRAQFSKQSAKSDQPLMMMQGQIDSLRADLQSNMLRFSENVNKQLGAVVNQLQSQTSTVGDRLDNATRVIGEIQKNLGELGMATREIKELGQSVSKLDELLRAPKLRGGLGEYMLEELLKQVLPTGNFQMQYRFRSGHIVDAVIHTSDGMVPVDSKFPLENFRKMISAVNEAEKRGHYKAFAGDVKKHIDVIAEKYIVPDEGTFPFALMYVPAENIYYEVVIKNDGEANGLRIYDYAVGRNVIPVSPNSMYAYLQVIALGLRGLRIEKSAREIADAITRLQGDAARMREAFDTLGAHIDNARKKYDEADRRLSNFEGRLENVTEQTLTSEELRRNLQREAP